MGGPPPPDAPSLDSATPPPLVSATMPRNLSTALEGRPPGVGGRPWPGLPPPDVDVEGGARHSSPLRMRLSRRAPNSCSSAVVGGRTAAWGNEREEGEGGGGA